MERGGIEGGGNTRGRRSKGAMEREEKRHKGEEARQGEREGEKGRDMNEEREANGRRWGRTRGERVMGRSGHGALASPASPSPHIWPVNVLLWRRRGP